MTGVSVAVVVAGTSPICAAPQEDVVDAGAANVVGRLMGDAEVEALVVEEHSDGGMELGGVERFDLNPDLLLLAEDNLSTTTTLPKIRDIWRMTGLDRAMSGRPSTRIQAVSRTATARESRTGTEMSTTSLLRARVMSPLRVS